MIGRQAHWIASLALVQVGAVTPPLQAQRVVKGVLIDSILGPRPLPGAVVEVDNGTRRITTDSVGRFQLIWDGRSVVSLGYRAPWLDSLGVERIDARLDPRFDKGDTVNVVLATPSPRSLQESICGAAVSDTHAVLIGEVRRWHGAEVPKAQVWARWWELRESDGRPEVHWHEVTAEAGVDGAYALCGVPRGVQLRLGASQPPDPRSEYGTEVRAPLVRRDLRIAEPGEYVALRGRVLSPEGNPIRDAIVSWLEDPQVSARSDSVGKFQLERVPARSGELELRHLGYRPQIVVFSPQGAAVDLSDLWLTRSSRSLEVVRISSRVTSRERADFERRRRGATGVFISDSLLSVLPRITPAATAAFSPRLRSVSAVGGTQRLLVRQGAGWCAPKFYADGVDVGRLELVEEAPEQALLLERAKRIEVYSAAQAPARFSDNQGCGAVVVWTR